MKEIIEQLKIKAQYCGYKTKEERARKGAYVDCIGMIKEKSGNLPEANRNAVLGEVQEKIDDFIKKNRKINWESAFEKEEYCIGENKVREFIAVLIGKHFA